LSHPLTGEGSNFLVHKGILAARGILKYPQVRILGGFVANGCAEVKQVGGRAE
jgi:hypothetical protein